MTLDKKVEKKVANLLALVIDDTSVDPDSYNFVLNKLTTMAILGTVPASGLSDFNTVSKQREPYDIEDDRSASKESWIAR